MIFLNYNILGLLQTVFNISRDPLEVSSPTTFKAASFLRDKSTTTVWGQRRATVPFSGRSPPQPLLTPSPSGSIPPLRLSPMAVTPLLMGPSSWSPTSVKTAPRSSQCQWLLRASNLNSVDQTLELREWVQLPSLLQVSLIFVDDQKFTFFFILILPSSPAAIYSWCLLLQLRPSRFPGANWVQHGLCSG